MAIIYEDYINEKSYNMDRIPEKVSISTMSVGCNLGTAYNMKNIADYMELNNDDIIAIKSPSGIRCIEHLRTRFKSMNKNSKRIFYNQYTMIIRVGEDKFINIKLFKNGSLQMTGCKQLSDVNIALYKLMKKLRETPNDISYVEKIEDLHLARFKIDFINTNFGVNYLINNATLYNILTKQNILCRLSAKHKCVNIKFKISTDIYVSVFIFQTGEIIITGGKTAENIRAAYVFIVRLLNKYKEQIIKINLENILSLNDFLDQSAKI